jgi:hypothetical protein
MKFLKDLTNSKNTGILCAGLIFAVLSILLFTSCRKGEDGIPGNAYLALQWNVQLPSYLDAGTAAIPPVFEWGRFYPAYPGYFTLYYEGDYYNGTAYNHYSWELNYQIWINPGEEGGFGYDGRNGPDSYLTIIISPFGPFTDRLNKSLPSGNGNYSVIEESDDLIKVLQENGKYSMMVVYKKQSATGDRQFNKQTYVTL